MISPKSPKLLCLVCVLALVLAANAARAGVVLTEFGVPTPGSWPYAISAGPDGNLWFVENRASKVSRITPAGLVTEFTVGGTNLSGICAGPDGNLWFTESGAPGSIGAISPSGTVVHEYAVPTANAYPFMICVGPDGNLWFTERTSGGTGAVAKVTTSGTFTEYKLPNPFSSPTGIASGPDGAIWFCEQGRDAIGRMTVTGTFSEFPTPTAGSGPIGIAAGSDGALWFTEGATSAIGRITTAGGVTNEYPLAAAASPWFLASGADGNLWFAAYGTDAIGRITPGGAEADQAIPTGGSGPIGVCLGPDGALWFTEQLGNKIGRVESPLSFYTLAPCRVLDTRGTNTSLGGPILDPGQLRKFPFAGACGIPAGAVGISGNVTVTGAAAAGDLRLFPADHPMPPTSTINFRAGQTRANNAIFTLGRDAQQTLSVQNDAGGSVHVIVDVDGYFQ